MHRYSTIKYGSAGTISITFAKLNKTFKDAVASGFELQKIFHAVEDQRPTSEEQYSESEWLHILLCKISEQNELNVLLVRLASSLVCEMNELLYERYRTIVSFLFKVIFPI